MNNEYNATTIKKRIFSVFTERGLKPYKTLPQIGLSKNTLDGANVSMPKADALAIIADYLETSTDYLLGRTDRKEMNITITAAPTISRTGEASTTTTGGIENITINEETSTEDREIVKMINSLSAVQKAKVILMIDDLKKESTNTTP